MTRPNEATWLAARGPGSESSPIWRWVEEPWQFRLLDQLPSSIDLTLLERTLAMKVSERVQPAQDLMETAEAALVIIPVLLVGAIAAAVLALRPHRGGRLA